MDAIELMAKHCALPFIMPENKSTRDMFAVVMNGVYKKYCQLVPAECVGPDRSDGSIASTEWQSV